MADLKTAGAPMDDAAVRALWLKRVRTQPADFLRARFGTLALLVEGARKDTSNPDERHAIVLAARPLWVRLLDRYLDGPAVSGRVVDAGGQPVERLHLREHTTLKTLARPHGLLKSCAGNLRASWGIKLLKWTTRTGLAGTSCRASSRFL